jgi:hypothetical protein
LPRMSLRISSAVAPHVSWSFEFPRIYASFEARSIATQHISFDDT